MKTAVFRWARSSPATICPQATSTPLSSGNRAIKNSQMISGSPISKAYHQWWIMSMTKRRIKTPLKPHLSQSSRLTTSHLSKRRATLIPKMALLQIWLKHPTKWQFIRNIMCMGRIRKSILTISNLSSSQKTKTACLSSILALSTTIRSNSSQAWEMRRNRSLRRCSLLLRWISKW